MREYIIDNFPDDKAHLQGQGINRIKQKKYNKNGILIGRKLLDRVRMVRRHTCKITKMKLIVFCKDHAK
jgi:hypothetical protein